MHTFEVLRMVPSGGAARTSYAPRPSCHAVSLVCALPYQHLTVSRILTTGPSVCRAVMTKSIKSSSGSSSERSTSTASDGDGTSVDYDALGSGGEDAALPVEDSDELDSSVGLGRAVIRITCVRDKPRFDLPIVLGSLSSTNRTAFALSYRGENFILTSAGSVTYSTKIQLHPGGSNGEKPSSSSSPTLALRRDKPWTATVAHIGMECDLALLKLDCGQREEQRFWSQVTPLELGDLPDLNDVVSILGTDSASRLSVQGGVSQIAVMGYASALMSLLGLKISAQTGKNQIGAPVVAANGSCVGLVISRQRQQSTGRRGQASGVEHYALAAPSTLIAQFLDGIISTGSYTGFPSLGIKYKKLEAKPLQAYLGLPPSQHGILIIDVAPLSAASKVLEPNDVLMSINGKDVGADGLIEFRGSDRILCTHYISMQPVGSDLELKLWRRGALLEVSSRAEVPDRLIPTHLSNKEPSYLIASGLIFTRCSVPSLEAAFGNRWMNHAPPLLITKLTDWPRQHGQETIILAEMIETDSLTGYDAKLLQHRCLARFNGTNVLSMKQLAAAVLRCTSEYMKFEFEGDSVVVLTTAEAKADTKQVMKEYELSLPVSEDLKSALTVKAHPRRKALATKSK